MRAQQLFSLAVRLVKYDRANGYDRWNSSEPQPVPEIYAGLVTSGLLDEDGMFNVGHTNPFYKDVMKECSELFHFVDEDSDDRHAWDLIDLCGGLVEEPEDTPKCIAHLIKMGVTDRQDQSKIIQMALMMQDDVEE